MVQLKEQQKQGSSRCICNGEKLFPPLGIRPSAGGRRWSPPRSFDLASVCSRSLELSGPELSGPELSGPVASCGLLTTASVGLASIRSLLEASRRTALYAERASPRRSPYSVTPFSEDDCLGQYQHRSLSCVRQPRGAVSDFFVKSQGRCGARGGRSPNMSIHNIHYP